MLVVPVNYWDVLFPAAFVFMDPSANEEKDLPPELSDKYTISKLLGKSVPTGRA